MKTHSLKIKAGLSSRDSKIELDGQELSGVKSISFELTAEGLTAVKLEIIGYLEVEGEFRESAILQISQAALPWFPDNAG